MFIQDSKTIKLKKELQNEKNNLNRSNRSKHFLNNNKCTGLCLCKWLYKEQWHICFTTY